MPDFFAFLDSVPTYDLAIIVYLGGSVIALWLWYFVAKSLPRSLGGMTWIIMFSCLLSPTITEGDNASLAPALVGVMFGILIDDKQLIWSNLIPILCVTALGFFLGYLWLKYQDNKQHLSSKN